MVGRHRIDHAVTETLDQRLPVTVGAERGIHLEQAGRLRLGREGEPHPEVMRCRLSGHVGSPFLGPPDHLHAGSRRHVLEVNVSLPGVGQSPQRVIDGAGLGLDWAERAALHRPLHPVDLGQDLLILGVDHHGTAEGHGAPDRLAEQARGEAVATVVAEGGGPGGGAGLHVDQLLSLQPLGESAAGQHLDRGGHGPEGRLLDPVGAVDRRHRVGHRHDLGETPGRGRLRAAVDGLGALVTRLTEVGVDVDEARTEDDRGAARGWGEVDDRQRPLAHVLVDGDDPALAQPDVLAGRVAAGERVDDPDTAEDAVHGRGTRKIPPASGSGPSSISTHSAAVTGRFFPT